MKIATRKLVRAVLIQACLIGAIGTAYAQSNSTRPGESALSATPSGANVNGAAAGTGAGTVGTAPGPTPGLATPGVSPGMEGTGAAGAGRALNNMRANGTSLYQNPDPRVPNLSGRPSSPR
jgi:hypothetical protein